MIDHMMMKKQAKLIKTQREYKMESDERVVTLYNEKDLALCNLEKEDLVTKQQAANLLGIAICTLNLYRAKGHITPVPTIDHRIYYLRQDIEFYKRLRDEQKERKRQSLPLEKFA